MEGEVQGGKQYTEADFNRIIEIKERERKRVEIFLSQIDQTEKTLVFCASQYHALAVRDQVNQLKKSTDPNYCHRVTADDGQLGEQHLRDFQDNEKSIPTVLTTSSTPSGMESRWNQSRRLHVPAAAKNPAYAKPNRPNRAPSAGRRLASARPNRARNATNARVSAARRSR